MDGSLAEQPAYDVVRVSVDLLDNNPQLKITELARRIYVSQRHLRRLFRRQLGCTPIQYRLRLRLRGASTQLRHGEYHKISDVAANWGFTDQAHFSKSFKSHFGLTPTAYVNLSKE